MPSVEMRRTTRVFGARVLRSGRRLFSNQEVIKHMRRAPLVVVADVEDDWIELIDHGKENGRWNSNEENKGKPPKEIKLRKSKEIDLIHVDDGRDSVTESKRWGLVYSRKRKRSELIDCENLDKIFGKKSSRKQSRKKIVKEELPSDLQPIATIEPPCVAQKSNSRKKKAIIVSVSKPTKLKLQNLPPKNGVNVVNGVSIHRGIRKRRRSLRLRKKRNPSSFGLLKSTSGFQDGGPFFPRKSKPEISRSIRKPSFKELKSTLVELTQNINSVSCNANILVIESDRCYREQGGVITMEMSDSNQWFLVVKRNLVERFRVDAKNVMRPCFINRITHAIIWASSDESWRLEFPERQDWFIFKELYRKCSERTVRVKPCLSSIIPVPRVNEVIGYAKQNYLPFKMPDLYISSKGDEVSRVLEKSDSVYDMDSDDDEWLNRFNDERDSQVVDENTFEKIIDVFERGIYGNPEEFSDVNLAIDRCLMITSKEVLKAVYDYWMIKRQKKHSTLIRAFQFYRPKKPEQLNIKAVLRKKRSFRKRGYQSGRGRQLTFLKVEEALLATNKVEETEAAAERAEQVAISKRQRAKLLMKVADLLTYKAAMALKIAETRAITSGGSVDDEYFFTSE